MKYDQIKPYQTLLSFYVTTHVFQQLASDKLIDQSVKMKKSNEKRKLNLQKQRGFACYKQVILDEIFSILK